MFRKAVLKLLTVVLPKCSFHSDRIATFDGWGGITYCDECARSYPYDNPSIIEHSYAAAVRELQQ